MQKSIVLLGCPESKTEEQFKQYYLQDHKEQLLQSSKVKRYVANIIEAPSEELIKAGWGWGGKDTSGIKAIDEVWCEDDSVLDMYGKSDLVIGAYNTNEVVLRPCYPEWPEGERSHWVKRIGLLKCFSEQRPEDFFQYWQHIHGPKALSHHIGAGYYVQNHITKAIKQDSPVWNGLVALHYWNIDAFQYGHFSRPESREIIKEDGSHFMEIFLALLASEYVQRR